MRVRRADVTVKVAVEALSRLLRHFLRAELLIKARYRRFPFHEYGRSARLGSAVSMFDKSSAAATGLFTFQREFVAPETTINFHQGLGKKKERYELRKSQSGRRGEKLISVCVRIRRGMRVHQRDLMYLYPFLLYVL